MSRIVGWVLGDNDGREKMRDRPKRVIRIVVVVVMVETEKVSMGTFEQKVSCRWSAVSI